MYPQPGMMPMQPNMGSSHYPPTFSYAPTGHAQATGGAYAGNRLITGGLGLATGMSGAAGMLASGAGIAAGFFPSIAAIGGGAAGAGGATSLGVLTGATALGTGASLGMASPMALAGGPIGLGLMAAGAGLSIANTGVQNANAVGNMFGNMQFVNASGDPTTGRGFSQNDLMTLQRGVRAIDANNPFVSMSDALRATERFTEMGMHQGVQDAEKLAKKVTELGKTMHQMARSLGTSMEEAGQIFKDMKGSGFYSAQDVMGNTANMTLMRGFGMSSQQFAQMQRTGAGMTRGAQMSGRAGAGMITAKTAEFMNAIRTGQMSAEEMMDMTGASTPLEAAQMMAQQTLAGTMGGLSGALGTGMLLAAGATDKSGRFTGEIDAGILRRMAQGNLSRNELMDIGGGKRGSRIGQASFTARRQDIMESMLESDQGQEALFGMVRSITEEMFGEGAGEDQDLFQLVAETQFNMDRRAVRKLQELKSGRGQRLSALKQEILASQRAAELRENATLSGAAQRIGGTISDAFNPLTDAASSYYRGVIESSQDVERFMLGKGSTRVTIGTTQEALDEAVMSAMMGRAGSGRTMGIGEAARRGMIGQALPSVSDDMVSRVRGTSAANAVFAAGSGKSAADADISGALRQIMFQADPSSRLKHVAAKSALSIVSPLGAASATNIGIDEERAAAIALKSAAPEDRERTEQLLAEYFKNKKDAGLSVDSTRSDQQDLSRLFGTRGATDFTMDFSSPFAAFGSIEKIGSVGQNVAFGGVSGALFSAARFAVDSNLEEAFDRIEQGGESSALLQKYEKSQKEIDHIIAGNDPDAAAKKLNKRFGLKISAQDVRDLEVLMQHKTGRNASERRTSGVDAGLLKKIGTAASNLVNKEAQRRVDEQLSSLGMAALRESGLERQFDSGKAETNFSALQRSIQKLAQEGFVATGADDVESQMLGFGVEAATAVSRAARDGLTMSELTDMGLSQDQVRKLVKEQGGSIAGSSIKVDAKKLGSAIGALKAADLGLDTDKRSLLDGGQTEQQIMANLLNQTDQNVRKTSEQVQLTAETLNKTGISYVAGFIPDPEKKEDG
jgi:hypothetical protein